MGLRELLGMGEPKPTGRPAGQRPQQDNLEADPEGGRLDPQTAALMDGTPPSSTSGRVTPSRRGADPEAGASEADANHLPG